MKKGKKRQLYGVLKSKTSKAGLHYVKPIRPVDLKNESGYSVYTNLDAAHAKCERLNKRIAEKLTK